MLQISSTGQQDRLGNTSNRSTVRVKESNLKSTWRLHRPRIYECHKGTNHVRIRLCWISSQSTNCAGSHLNQQRAESQQEYRECGIDLYILFNSLVNFCKLTLTRKIH